MNERVDKIMAEAMELPSCLRTFLAAKLRESLDGDDAIELPLDWKEEIRKRCWEIDEGAVQLVEAEEAFARAYSKLT